MQIVFAAAPFVLFSLVPLGPLALAAAPVEAGSPGVRPPSQAIGVLPLNPVQIENALPGNAAGLAPDTATGGVIEGYASEVSALPGDTLHLHVSTNPATSYRVEVYRLGWYDGSGARLIGCTPSCSTFMPGQPLAPPAPDSGDPIRAAWPVTATFVVPANATSGYYLVRFLLSNGQASSTYVIVRAPEADKSAILVQVPVNTWQAYNGWGGQSLYELHGIATQSNRVSFDRPYAAGTQYPLGWEYPIVLFLEQSGYDVSYQTDVDTDDDPSSLLGHRLVIDVGHDEYWTAAMRGAFEQARDSGVNLAFLGANDVYWRMRYEDSGRTIVVYKSRANRDPIEDPALQTGMFRVVDRPECELIGIQHQGGTLTWAPGDFRVVPSSLTDPWFLNSGFDAGGVLPGLVSVEADTIPQWDGGASCGHKLTVFFHHEAGGDQLGNADSVAYTAPSGATVFAAGSLQFGWGLADPPAVTGLVHGLVDPRLQRFVRNMLDSLSGRNLVDLAIALKQLSANAHDTTTVNVIATVSNLGPDTPPTVILDLAMPSGLTFSRVASKSIRCTLAPLRCVLAQLLPGTRAEAVFTLRVTRLGTRELAAHVFSPTTTDPDPASARARLTIRTHRLT